MIRFFSENRYYILLACLAINLNVIVNNIHSDLNWKDILGIIYPLAFILIIFILDANFGVIKVRDIFTPHKILGLLLVLPVLGNTILSAVTIQDIVELPYIKRILKLLLDVLLWLIVFCLLASKDRKKI